MDKETELLSRLAANHLYLAQFEPLRAILLALRPKNPDLALSILQTIVANSGHFDDNILWSPSCPSPSLLTFLSTLELLNYGPDCTSRTWSFDPGMLKLRAEFFLLVQVLSDAVTEKMRRNVDLEGIEKEKDNDDDGLGEKEELLNASEDLKDVSGELGENLRVLDKVLELGIKRLKPDILAVVKSSDNFDIVNEDRSVFLIEEGETMCLRRIILEHADVFDALCWNIQQQLAGDDAIDNSGLALTVRGVEKASKDDEEEVRVLTSIQKSVQLAHLEAMKECLDGGDEDKAISHIRYLRLHRGVEEAEYRYAHV